MVYRKISLMKRLTKLKEYNSDIKTIGNAEYDEYLKDIKTRYSIERLLFLICGTIFDFLDHILSSKHNVVSDNYENILENSWKRKVIDDSLYSQLKGLGGFRNILAHEYLKLSDEEVYKHSQKFIQITDDVIEAFESII